MSDKSQQLAAPAEGVLMAGFRDRIVDLAPYMFDDAAAAATRELERAWLSFHDRPVDALVVDAAVFAVRAHTGQRRKSGELYISHPLHVAAIVAAAGFDEISVAAALCHDVIEDCDVDAMTLASATTVEVAHLVDGVSKVDRVHFPSAEQAAAASMTKFLVAVVDDVRVLAIKLADRLHNLRTVDALPRDRQLRLAVEALEVFSPLAHRLGMEDLRRELEDRAFAVHSPQDYEAVANMVATSAPDADSVRERVAAQLADGLTMLDPAPLIEHRVKHLYSVYNKLSANVVDPTDLGDLIGVRIVVGSVADCYATLGVIHSMFTPLPGRFKDFIALPKSNGYQSLHTTVRVGTSDVEIQIRTRDMHARARFGVAAHYTYKQGSNSSAPHGRGRDAGLAEAWATSSTLEEFFERLRLELAPETEVVVLTPQGKPVVLPAGSCAIDFAYAIHSEVGNRCVGARVDGVLVPIREPLSTGSVVDIVTSPTASPSADWPEFCRTPRARERIRRFLSESSASETASGLEVLSAELARRDVEVSAVADEVFLRQLASDNQMADPSALLSALASGELKAMSLRGLPARKVSKPSQRPAVQPSGSWSLDGLPFTVAGCCNPTCDVAAAGFVTAARVVSVHRVDCPNYQAMVAALDPGAFAKLIPVTPHDATKAWVEIRSADRHGLLTDVSAVCAALGVDIVTASSTTIGNEAVTKFDVHVIDGGHLAAVVEGIRSVPSVMSVSSSALDS